VDQIGLPIPTIPVVLALGALAGTGRINPVTGLPLAIAGSLCADLVWFQLGRWRGSRILGLICRVSLEPDACVSKTQDLFSRHGLKSLLVAKFVPGFDTVAPPLAGLLGVRRGSFVLWSIGGALIWLGVYGGLGYLLSGRFEELAIAAQQFSTTLAWLAIALLAIYVAQKYFARQRILREIRMARISADELHQMIVSGRGPVIIDARSKSALDALPLVIEGALRLTIDELDERRPEIPREGEVVVYCSCPNELSSARLALKLKRLGIPRVRPLMGGIEAWRARSFPVVPR
jgi:membrane protein DedA with SNARE-associated domain/rhodanese-related sulfurtransferase